MESESLYTATLDQNIPNPFSQTSSISYYLPQSVKNATMQIVNISGKVIENIVLKDRGVTSLTVDARDFSQGTYFYFLIIEGKTITTKKMVTVGN